VSPPLYNSLYLGTYNYYYLFVGLQAPSIYRLKSTWARVKKYHSTAYSVFKKLCLEYSMPILPDLSKAPYIPTSHFFIDTIFGKIGPDDCGGPDSKQSGTNKMLRDVSENM